MASRQTSGGDRRDSGCRLFVARSALVSRRRRVRNSDSTRLRFHRSDQHSGAPSSEELSLTHANTCRRRRAACARASSQRSSTMSRGPSRSVKRDGALCSRSRARLQPDIVFLDIQMPELTGIEVVERLRKVHPTPAVVFTTAPRPVCGYRLRTRSSRLPAETVRCRRLSQPCSERGKPSKRAAHPPPWTARASP